MNRQHSIQTYLFKASGSAFALRAGALGMSFLTTFLLTRWLETEEYGIYAWCITWFNLLAFLATLGFDQFLVREVAAAVSRNENGLIPGLTSSVRKYVLVFSLLIAAAGAVFALTRSGKESSFAFLIALTTVPVAALISVYQAIMRGMKKIGRAGIPELFIRPLLFLSAIILLFFTAKGSLSPQTVLFANLLAYLAAFLASGILLHRFGVKKTEALTLPKKSENPGAFSGIYFLILNGAALINNKMDILMIGFLRPEIKDVGLYHVASNLSLLLTFFLVSANTALAPLLSDLFSRQETRRLQEVVSKTVRIVFLFTLPLGLVFILFGRDLLSLFGQEYGSAYYVLLILTVGQLFNVGCGSVGYILSMSGNEKLVALSMWAGALLNVVFNFILIPAYGLTGAAIATMSGTIAWNLIMAWLCVKKTGIHSTAAGKISI